MRRVLNIVSDIGHNDDYNSRGYISQVSFGRSLAAKQSLPPLRWHGELNISNATLSYSAHINRKQRRHIHKIDVNMHSAAVLKGE